MFILYVSKESNILEQISYKKHYQDSWALHAIKKLV